MTLAAEFSLVPKAMEKILQEDVSTYPAIWEGRG